MFREVSVVEAREVLRLWLKQYSLREIARMLGVDRKTVRRYVQAAVDAGSDQSGGEDQLGDELLGVVVGEIRTGRPAGAQRVALRARADRTLLALTSGAVFALAVIVGVAVGDPQSADWRTAHIVAGAVAGAVVGVAGGAAFLWRYSTSSSGWAITSSIVS